MSMLQRALFTLLLLAGAGFAQADVFRPAYLELRESGVDRYEVMWKLPVQGDTRLGVQRYFGVNNGITFSIMHQHNDRCGFA